MVVFGGLQVFKMYVFFFESNREAYTSSPTRKFEGFYLMYLIGKIDI